MCLLKYFYYYSWTRNNNSNLFKKELDDEWNDANKISGTCITCCKYSNRITKENELCYRCFENWFYENK